MAGKLSGVEGGYPGESLSYPPGANIAALNQNIPGYYISLI